jgi:translation initiation factor 2-alpha kinase 4
MEYCERRTLRDLIKRGISKDGEEIWRILRQIIEGLAHIHGLNVVHRDLKPENVFIDGAVNVRIGDFGLATSGHYSAPDKVISGHAHGSHNMTTSVGTFYYVAPEVRSAVGTYNSKVDMYSLGIILFEMCYPPVEGMERAKVLQGIRQKQPLLPSDFNIAERKMQAEIILSLVDHNPKDRPSSSGLLQSGKLPIQMESETIRQTLAGLSDPKSPYYQKMMAALFSRPMSQAEDFAWDMDGSSNPGVQDLMLQSIVKQKLMSIFRRHGALECPRPCLLPRSGHYGPNTVQLLDPSGTLVQLPYDLTLPFARQIAKNAPSLGRSFTFGNVFRDKSGRQPQSFGEVDFDIVSDSLDLALKDAEVIKVLDEIVIGFPSLAATQMCFHINHSDLLNLIFDFCKIDQSIRSSVAEVLSKLNIQQWTWQKIRNELRSPLIGVSVTCLDELQHFDFRGKLIDRPPL